MWLKRIIIALYSSLLVVVPLIMSSLTSEMFEIPKMLTIYVITTTIIACYLAGIALRLWRPYLGTIGYLLIFWISTQALATLFSIDWYTSLFGYYGRLNGGLLSTLMYAALIYIGAQLFNRRDLTVLSTVAVLSGCLVLLWGLPGRFLHFDTSCYVFRGEWTVSCWTDDFRPRERMFSTLGQPNWLGTYFAVLVFVAYGIGQQVKTNWKKYIMYGLSLSLAVGLWCTGSRSAQLGLVCGIGIYIAKYLSHAVSKKMFVGIWTVVLIVAVGIGAWYAQSLLTVTAGTITHSGSIRLIVWEGAVKLFARYPLFGTGPETFAYTYPLTRPARHNLTTEKDFVYNKAHNEFLNILATSGIVGIAGYLALMIWSIRTAYLHRRYSTIAAMVAMHVANFLGFSTSCTQLLLVILLIDTYIPDIQRDKMIRTTGYLWSTRSGVLTVLSTLIILAGAFNAYQYWTHYILADVYYASALSESQSGYYIESLPMYKRAYEQRAEHVYENRFALTAAQAAHDLAREKSTDSAITDDDILSLERLSLILQTRALSRSPRNPTYWRDRVKLGIYLGAIATDEAQIAQYKEMVSTSINRAQELAPTDLSLAEIRGLMK
ncbi:MAG: O-antigen ligase family protein [Candidatus Roizmanbacteria bacterium]